LGQTRESDWDAWAGEAKHYVDSLGSVTAMEEKHLDRLAERKQAERELAIIEYKMAQDAEKSAEESVWAQMEAWHKRNQEFIDLDRDYSRKATDLWQDYAHDVADIDADLTAFHAGTLADLLELDAKFQNKRADLWRDYQDDLTDAERKFQQNIADLNQNRLDKIADENKEYGQKKVDLLLDLNRDLEDIEDDHVQTMLDLETEYFSDLEDLHKDYGDKLTSIDKGYAEERQAILAKYSLEPETPSIDERREALMDRLKELQELADKGQAGYYERLELDKLLKELDALKEGELAALEDRKSEELDELKKWLDEEELARRAAYEAGQQEALSQYEEQKAERRERYAEAQEDLKIAHEREMEEIRLNYQRRQKELEIALARERETLAINYARRQAEINTEYDAERALIETKLQEQLQAAKDKYQEGLRDLADWYDDQKETVSQKYQDQNREIEYQVGQGVLKAQAEFNKMPGALQPTWDALKTQSQTQAADTVNAIIAEFQRMFDWFGLHSPSEKMQWFGEGITSGLEKGLPADAITDLIARSMGLDAVQANIQSALGGVNLSAAMPSQQIVMPPVGMASQSSTTNNNLSVTAQYKQYQSEGSLRDTILGLKMGMNALPRR